MLRCVATIWVLSALALSGCANLNKPPPTAEQQQQEALVRWERCLDREATSPSAPNLIATSDLMMTSCEGHRRDVLMTFPASMERQLNQVLIQRTHEHALRAAALKMRR